MKTKRRKDFNLKMFISQKSSKMWTAKSSGFNDKVAVLNILHLPFKIHCLSYFVPKKLDLIYYQQHFLALCCPVGFGQWETVKTVENRRRESSLFLISLPIGQQIGKVSVLSKKAKLLLVSSFPVVISLTGFPVVRSLKA